MQLNGNNTTNLVRMVIFADKGMITPTIAERFGTMACDELERRLPAPEVTALGLKSGLPTVTNLAIGDEGVTKFHVDVVIDVPRVPSLMGAMRRMLLDPLLIQLNRFPGVNLSLDDIMTGVESEIATALVSQYRNVLGDYENPAINVVIRVVDSHTASTAKTENSEMTTEVKASVQAKREPAGV